MAEVQQIAPRVSVVIPTHNRPALLIEALESLAAQSMPHWEAVIVDDASDPPVDEAAVRRRFGPRVQVWRHDAPKGGAGAKNAGIALATAPVIAFLDDDDLYAPDYLSRALDVLDRHNDLDGLFMGVSWFGDAGEWASADYERSMGRALDLADGVAREPALLVFGPRLFEMLLQTVPMAFQRPVVRRAALDEIGLYEPQCLLWDCDWAIRAAAAHRFALLLEPLYHQRAQGQGTSSRADRALDHMLSGVEIRERLHANAGRYGLTGAQRRAVRDSAASAWFTLAYFQCTQRKDAIAALSAWFQSQKRRISPRRVRLLARIFVTLFQREPAH